MNGNHAGDARPITREDWARFKDTRWYDMNLTWTEGWKQGTTRSEKGSFERAVEPPSDRLITVRCLEYIPKDSTKSVACWSEIIWCSPDSSKLEAAQEDWGVLPKYAEPISDISATQYRTLKNIRLMRQDSNSRPRGKRDRPWW